MRILIVSATEEEVKPLLKELSSVRNHSGALKKGRYKKLYVDVLISGIGMVSTAYHCAKKISNEYDCVINAGIAGSFRKDILPGTVVHVVHDRFSELGAESKGKFLSFSELGLTAIETVDGFVSIKNPVIKKLKKARGISVNTVHGNSSSIKNAIKRFKPDIESMEGAAFLFVCKNEGVPCAQIRSISNFVEPRNKKNWNIPLAVENLNKKIVEILEKFL